MVAGVDDRDGLRERIEEAEPRERSPQGKPAGLEQPGEGERDEERVAGMERRDRRVRIRGRVRG